MSLARCHNIAALRLRARGRLPRPIFDYIDGGADDERALRNSSEDFAAYELLPDMLADVSKSDHRTTLFGREIAWPLMLSPTGLTRMFHPHAELAVARAAQAAGLPYCLSTLGTTLIEDLGAATTGPKLFQIYIFKDRGLTREFIARAKAAGYDGLVLTVDTLTAGNRERDRINGLSLPPRLTMKSALDFATRPGWSLPVLAGRKFDFVNVSHRVDELSRGPTSLFAYVDSQFDRSLTWKDFEWLSGAWDGPLALKGILTASDARRAADSGATAVMVSNHGGRQLGDAASPIDQIGPVAEAVDDRMEVICDGGVRRGSDVVKALALGAKACSIGRAYLYGLAAGGEAGVTRALSLLHDEYVRTMLLAGLDRPGAAQRRHVRTRAERHARPLA